MERSGNGSGSQGEYVHIFLQLLDLLLVGHPEPLFLVDNQQSQIFKHHILGQYPVGSDENVHHALF